MKATTPSKVIPGARHAMGHGSDSWGSGWSCTHGLLCHSVKGLLPRQLGGDSRTQDFIILAEGAMNTQRWDQAHEEVPQDVGLSGADALQRAARPASGGSATATAQNPG